MTHVGDTPFAGMACIECKKVTDFSSPKKEAILNSGLKLADFNDPTLKIEEQPVLAQNGTGFLEATRIQSERRLNRNAGSADLSNSDLSSNSPNKTAVDVSSGKMEKVACYTSCALSETFTKGSRVGAAGYEWTKGFEKNSPDEQEKAAKVFAKEVGNVLRIPGECNDTCKKATEAPPPPAEPKVPINPNKTGPKTNDPKDPPKTDDPKIPPKTEVPKNPPKTKEAKSNDNSLSAASDADSARGGLPAGRCELSYNPEGKELEGTECHCEVDRVTGRVNACNESVVPRQNPSSPPKAGANEWVFFQDASGQITYLSPTEYASEPMESKQNSDPPPQADFPESLPEGEPLPEPGQNELPTTP